MIVETYHVRAQTNAPSLNVLISFFKYFAGF